MLTSRQKILDYLRSHQTCTASELSRVMLMTPANARHHLKILVDHGAVIRVVGHLPANQRGRPEMIYRLAEPNRQNNLAVLADVLLQEIVQAGEPGGLDHLLPNLADGIVNRSGPLQDQDSHGSQDGRVTPENLAVKASLAPRLAQAMKQLNSLHYQARWEARPGAPDIYFGHCPYRDIIAGHPELCRMDALILQRLTGRSVEQTAKLAPDRAGGHFCRFRLHAS